MRGYSRRLITVMLLGTSASAPAAQVLRPAADPPPSAFALELMRPALNRDAIGADLGLLTTVQRYSLRVTAGAVVITAALPVSIVSVPDADFTSTLVGNLSAGLELRPDQPVIAGFEVLIPTAGGGGDDDGDFAVVAGFAADYPDLETYFQDVLSVRGTMGYRWRSPSGLVFRLAARPSVLIPTGDLSGDPELFVDYAAQLDYAAGKWTVGAAFNGRVLVTEENFFFGRVVHTMDLGAVWALSDRFHPGAVLRLPLDGDLGDLVGPSLGLLLEVPLGGR